MQLTIINSVGTAPLVLLAGFGPALPDDPAPARAKVPAKAAFHPPERLRAGSDFIRTEAPGYATPAWYDATGDGRPDLVVGQFQGGKIQVFPSLEDGSRAVGQWMRAGGKVAEVPGVW